MKEHITRMAVAATLGIGAWFIYDRVPQQSTDKQPSPRVLEYSTTLLQNSKNKQEFDPRTPEMVTRINAAIAFLEACPNPAAREAANKYLEINNNSKIAMAFGNEIGENAIGIVVLLNDLHNFDLQIGISPQKLLDPKLEDREVARQMLKAVSTIEIVKETPEKYDKDVEFKTSVNQNAEILTNQVLCAK